MRRFPYSKGVKIMVFCTQKYVACIQPWRMRGMYKPCFSNLMETCGDVQAMLCEFNGNSRRKRKSRQAFEKKNHKQRIFSKSKCRENNNHCGWTEGLKALWKWIIFRIFSTESTFSSFQLEYWAFSYVNARLCLFISTSFCLFALYVTMTVVSCNVSWFRYFH